MALPDGYSRSNKPYPVLFAADANAEFGIVVETARLLGLTKTIPGLVIVGIGYANPGQGFKASFAARALDLTPATNAAELTDVQSLAKLLGFPVPQALGGAPEFLNFLRGELVPSIERRYNVRHDDRAWLGHSYGGLFGIYALLNSDGLFQRFLLGSPSPPSAKTMFANEDAYFVSHKSLPARVFFAVGSEEEAANDPMVSDLRAFTAQLKTHGYQGLEFESQVFDGETHLSVIPTTISRGLRYIYANPPADANTKQ